MKITNYLHLLTNTENYTSLENNLWGSFVYLKGVPFDLFEVDYTDRKLGSIPYFSPTRFNDIILYLDNNCIYQKDYLLTSLCYLLLSQEGTH